MTFLFQDMMQDHPGAIDATLHIGLAGTGEASLIAQVSFAFRQAVLRITSCCPAGRTLAGATLLKTTYRTRVFPASPDVAA